MPFYVTRTHQRRGSRIIQLVGFGLLIALVVQPLSAHVFVSRTFRQGAYPGFDGGGWMAECYLNVPNYDLQHFALLQDCMGGPFQFLHPDCLPGDIDTDFDIDLRDMAEFQIAFHDQHLIRAQRYLDGREPDFTFRTTWIDFPAGPSDSDLDASFATIGDFLSDYIYDVSDPSKLDEPFGAFYIRFTGLLKVTLEDEVRVRDLIGLPVWIDVGTMAYDAYRLRIGEVIYQRPNVKWAQPFHNFGPAVEVLGLFPIEITYLNIHDPEGQVGNERAGIEVYSWHGDGLPWPAGNQMVHEVRGPATLLPPRAVYQPGDERPVANGDFDADFDVDLQDFQWFQFCSDPEFFFLPTFCRVLDFDGDNDVDLLDHSGMTSANGGPGVPSDGVGDP